MILQPDGRRFLSCYKEINQLSEQMACLKAEGVQQTPLFANSVEECTDRSKVYVQ